MGDVLVRKSNGYLIPVGDGSFYSIGGGKKEPSLPKRNPAGLERTPRAAATAQEAGVRAAANLARMPSSGSVNDPNLRRKIGIQRSTAKDAIKDAAPRSLQEQVAVRNFQRLKNYEKYNPNLRDRAAERAGRVGVLGSTAGKLVGGALGVLQGATALSDASAAGQDLSSALGAAGQRVGQTYLQTSPFLSGVGARVGGRLGSASVIAPYNIRQGARNVSQAMDNIAQGLEAERQPVAVTPTVAAPTRAVLPTKPIFTGQGPTTQMRYSQQLTPDQLRARRDNINTSAQYNMGPTANQQAELRHIDRQLNPSTVGQPFNPQVQPGAMDEMFGQRVSYTPGSSRFSVPTVASPVNQPEQKPPVMVQQKITTPKQAEAALFETEEPKETEGGAKPALEGASAAAQSAISAFNEQEQQPPIQEELENKETKPGQTGVSGA